MERKKICWITADYFADCDTPLVPLIAEKYDIHWIILFNAHGNRYKEEDFKELVGGNNNISLQFIYKSFHGMRGLNPFLLIHSHRIGRAIKKSKADIVYFNAQRDSLFDLPMIWKLP